MNLIYQKMFDWGDLMSKRKGLIRLETMDYDLSVFKIPKIFIRVASDVFKKKKLRYSDLGGMRALKGQILKHEIALNPKVNFRQKPAIFVGNGVEEVLFSAVKAILKLPENRNRNEIILFSPGYSLFEACVKVAGGKTKFARGLRPNEFVPTINEVKSKITKKTCAIIFANPNNPTTVCYKEKFLKELVQLAKIYNLFLISDEIYAEMVRKPRVHQQIITINNGLKNLVKVFGPSKDRPGMTGLKIGYLIGDKRLKNNLNNEYLARNFTINILSEEIFLIDLTLRTSGITGKLSPILAKFSKTDIEDYYQTVNLNMKKIFTFQDEMVKILKSSRFVSDFIMPQGCNMLFFKYIDDISSKDFLENFLDKGVGLYAGEVFHLNSKRDGSWSRICITQDLNKLKEGIKRGF